MRKKKRGGGKITVPTGLAKNSYVGHQRDVLIPTYLCMFSF